MKCRFESGRRHNPKSQGLGFFVGLWSLWTLWTDGQYGPDGQYGRYGLMGELIREHGGYRKLKTFQLGQLIYDVTIRFCDRWIEKRSRTHDQMVQAARSGVQNIAEGSQASATSKKFEIKLTSVARASLEELRLDYEDFLRQNQLRLWEKNNQLRTELISLRPRTSDDVARWVKDRSAAGYGVPKELAANAILVLIGVASSLLNRQIKSLADTFRKDGGFTERLYHHRRKARKN